MVPEWVLVPGGGLVAGGFWCRAGGWWRGGGEGRRRVGAGAAGLVSGVGSIVGHALLLAGRI